MMQCNLCGCERFQVVHIKRNRKYDKVKKQWIYSPDFDARKIICCECNQVYFVQSGKVVAAVYDKDEKKTKYIDPEELTP
jgi:hypothetical protein